MSELALLGGPAVAAHLPDHGWPPRNAATAKKLHDLYMSGNWSFDLDGQESTLCREFARAHDAKYGIFMANGTVTLQCALAAYDIGPGDEVIIPALTCTTSVMPIMNLGATAVFVDVEPTTLCLDPAKVSEAITPNTRAIMPVHLYGSMVDMDRILKIAKDHNLIVIEDAAHVHGGKWNGRGIGSLGHVGSFSFQQKKPMSAGEGGICITNDPCIAEKIHRMIHIGYAYGEYRTRTKTGFEWGLPCSNLSATEFQALIVRDQLAAFDQQIHAYQQSIALLNEALAQVPGVRIQSVGRLASPQTYNKVLFVFDEGPITNVPIELIMGALGAEGLTVGRTFGVVYDHPHFIYNSKQYRIPETGCPVSKQLGELRGVVLDHPWLGLSAESVDAIGSALSKVATCHGVLLRQVKKRTEGDVEPRD